MSSRLSPLFGLVLLLAGLSPAGQAATAVDPRQTWQLLDYVAVDYPAAVQDGQVVSEGEYAEMREFAGAVRSQLQALPATPGQADLIAQADELSAAIEAKAAPTQVGGLARHLADGLLLSYPVGAVPAVVPDVARVAPLYARTCAGCHGVTGHADGPAAASLDPPPIDFTDASRAAQRSPFALYEAISQGIQGTAMTSYEALPEADRWALAFYVGNLANGPEARSRGEMLWNTEPTWRDRIPDLETLTRTSEADLVAAGHAAADAQAVIAFLRAQPNAIAPATAVADAGPLALARKRLADSVSA